MNKKRKAIRHCNYHERNNRYLLAAYIEVMTEVLDELRISSYSTAGHGTSVVVEVAGSELPHLSVCFDLGYSRAAVVAF